MKKIINILCEKENQKKYIIYLYCLLNSFIFLFICSKCSFFYKFNNWDDANSFFTMGKGMANGLIIYKDLFEQKGPIIYLIHAIAYLISNDTFLGVFIFEVISYSVFLYYINKIISIYVKKVHILWILPLISSIILTSYVFIAGDSAEEFCFPFLAISLYYMLDYLKNTYPNKMDTKKVIINGILAGCVLCIKYNLLGFWIGFLFFLCLGLLINKKVKEAFLTGIYFLLGMIIVAIPWIIYFAINNALYDMFYVYFFVNMSSYSTKEAILTRIFRALNNALYYAKNLKNFSYITLAGYIYAMISKNILPNVYSKIALTLTIVISIIGVYYGADHIYYFLILMPFVVLGLIFIAKMIDKIIGNKKTSIIKILTPVYIVIFAFVSCKTSSNFNFHNTKKEDLVQFQFAEIIKEKEDATLLNYGFLDGGFYTLANITPNIKYFHKPNIKYEKYPEIMDEQNRYIREKIIDFVVIKVKQEEDSKKIPYLYENYDNIKNVFVPDSNNNYMLFKVKLGDV